MDLEVLVSTMNEKEPQELYKTMRLNTSATIINQTNDFCCKDVLINNNRVRILSFNELGVGLSRNNALMRSEADICIMADDDMIYNEDYAEIINNAYEKYKDADMILFNVIIHQDNKKRRTIKKNGRVRRHNCLKYGTVMFTFKKKSIQKKRISFSLLFGGGAKYGCGEDSLFIWDVLNSGLKVQTCSDTIAHVYNDDSSWFTGYNEKYFYDKGALFKALSPNLYSILIFQFLFRHKKLYKGSFSFKNVFKTMYKGAREF